MQLCERCHRKGKRHWTAAVEEVFSDEALRARLIAAGRINARRFSWERTARLTLQVYRYAAGAELAEHLPAEQLPAEPLPAGPPSEWEEATTPATEG